MCELIVSGLEILGSNYGIGLRNVAFNSLIPVVYTLATVDSVTEARVCESFDYQPVRFIMIRSRSATDLLYLSEVTVADHDFGICDCGGDNSGESGK